MAYTGDVYPITLEDAAREGGVSVDTIRHFEKSGFLPPPKRSSNGAPCYDFLQVRRICFIARQQELGYTDDEIRTVLAGFTGNKAARIKSNQILQQRIAQLQARSDTQKRFIDAMKAMTPKGDSKKTSH